MALKAGVSVSVTGTLSSSPDVGSAASRVAETFLTAFTNGTGADQANNIFADDFTITGAGTQSYDLAGGVTNALGAALTFTAIKALIIKNTGTAPLALGAGTNPFRGWLADATDKINIPAGGLLVLTDPSAAGQAVTAATGDLLALAGTDAAGTIIIIGEA